MSHKYIIPKNKSANRCAIYTRKSKDEREDSQLSSIDRQHELCATYIASQGAEGWATLATRYDDPGYSGGSTDRPALQRLLADIAAGRVDTVVVYKIDRLSRSLRDFVDLVDLFARHDVAFVATTQAFNTSTSMGRLTLNILLSFAQFERELTGERSRDWKAGARARGLWTSGPPPFGYRVRNLRLESHPDNAPIVVRIFRRFARLGGYAAVANELNAAGLVNRLGHPFDPRTIKAIVSSRTYLGELGHRGEFKRGIHQPIVSAAAWSRAEAAIAAIDAGRVAAKRLPVAEALNAIVTDADGHRLHHLDFRRAGLRYYGRRGARYAPRYRAPEIEDAVLARIATLTAEDPVAFLANSVDRIEIGPGQLRIVTDGMRFEVEHVAWTRQRR